MSPNSLRTLRKDLSVIASVLLLGLVALCALTGIGMDDLDEGIFLDDDVHSAIGWAMTAVAAFHALLNLGSMRKYAAKRLRAVTQAAPPAGAQTRRAADPSD